MDLPLSGVYAALITPVDSSGRLDLARYDRLIDFVMGRGVDGLCIGGGTSEYPHFDLEERKQLISRASKRLGDAGLLISAIGTSSYPRTRMLGEHAASVGSELLLVPPPHFYPYEQEDLAVFYRDLAEATEIPCLIYNLPAFTQPLELETIKSLLNDVSNVAGIKDSSGETDHFEELQELRSQQERVTLLCGSDEVFLPALEAGWDGCISGLASCCPELLTAVYEQYRSGNEEGADRAHRLLNEFAGKVLKLPFPWGIRVAAAVRGLENGPPALPLSPRRKQQVSELEEELRSWFAECEFIVPDS